MKACLKHLRGWERKYKDKMIGSVKAQVEGEINKMKAEFKAYLTGMAFRKEALHPSGPPPTSVSMPSANNGQTLMYNLQLVSS